MKWLWLLRIIFRHIFKNTIRGFLSVITIGIGITVVALVLNIINHLNDSIYNIYKKEGIRIVIAKENTENESYSFKMNQCYFSLDDMRILKDYIHDIQYISPVVQPTIDYIEYNDIYFYPKNFLGVGADYFQIYDLSAVAGSFFTESDIEIRRNVVILSEKVARILFGDAPKAIGQFIFADFFVSQVDTLKNTEFTNHHKLIFEVIGVYKNITPLKQDVFGIAHFLIPYTLNDKTHPKITHFLARVKDSNVQNLKVSIPNILHDIYRDATKVSVWEGNIQYPMDDKIKEIRDLYRQILVFFSAIGMITLLISSSVIYTNLMISILESTNEIGLMRAIGLSRTMVVIQFHLEAMTLLIISSPLWISFTLIFNNLSLSSIQILLDSFGLNHALHFNNLTTIKSILESFIISLIFGTVLGIYPAFSAARISPIEGLREI
jgi:putative ABC transport system permease protein